MKNLVKVLFTAALLASPSFSFAQSDETTRTNAQLVEWYKYEIEATKDNINANKKRIKNEPGNATYQTQKKELESRLGTLKAKKKAVTAAVEAENDYAKAQEKAANTQKESEGAITKAKKAQQEAVKAIGTNPENRSLEEYSNQYKLEIGALEDELAANKKRQKASPTDSSLKSESQDKKTQISELKAKKKLVDEAIEATKDSQSAEKKAKSAQEDLSKAKQKAESTAAAADRAVGRK